MARKRLGMLVLLACGAAGAAIGAAIAVLGGSDTLSWTVGLAGMGLLLLALAEWAGFDALFRNVSRRVQWLLAALAVGLVVFGGVVYALSPSETVWWLGGAAALPLTILLMSLREHEPSTGSADGDGVWAPPGDAS